MPALDNLYSGELYSQGKDLTDVWLDQSICLRIYRRIRGIMLFGFSPLTRVLTFSCRKNELAGVHGHSCKWRWYNHTITLPYTTERDVKFVLTRTYRVHLVWQIETYATYLETG